MNGLRPRPLVSGDVSWAADVMVARRSRYAAYSPRFWNPAPNARAAHEPYLASCLANERFAGWRTDDGFIFAELHAPDSPPWRSPTELCFVDDFAVTRDDAWLRDGRALLLQAWEHLEQRGARQIRVVTARRDEPKVAMLEALGLTVGESWWVNDGAPRGAAEAQFGAVSVGGVTALVIPAPPVYDPGGPVLLVQTVDAAEALAGVAAIAAAQGAVLVIVPASPADAELVSALRSAAFDEVSQYYVGRPAAAD